MAKTCKERQEEYTAVYDTDYMTGIEYSFLAKSVDAAVTFCRNKFRAESIELRDSRDRVVAYI